MAGKANLWSKTVRELTRTELRELKQRMLCEKGEALSYGEMANIDESISDEQVFAEYEGVKFGPEDFFCNL